VESTVKAIREATEGLRLQVSFGSETALILSMAHSARGSLKTIFLDDPGVQEFDRFFDRFPTEVPLFSVLEVVISQQFQ
jgi:hypothetical protein